MAGQLPIIVIDSREQLPWAFQPTEVLTSRGHLNTGDYSIQGFENEIAVERKSLDDLVKTLFADWTRFKKELRRLSGFEYGCIAVEADLKNVAEKNYNSDVHPHSVLGRCHSIYLDYGIPVFWWGQRPFAAPMAQRFLLLAHKRIIGAKSEVA